MLQRLPVAFAQVKTVNTSENVLNDTNQIIYSLSRTKWIIKKVHTWYTLITWIPESSKAEWILYLWVLEM